MRLERVQADFAAALTDAAAVAELAPALLVRDAPVRERIALYRGNVTAAWERALANACPVVRRLVGEEFFTALARAYGRAHPSVSGDLNVFGAHFAAFVAAFEHTQSLPYLGDVAALEWALHRAHYAADAQAPTRAYIAALPPGELLAARFALHPACCWLESRYPVASIWLAHQARSDVDLPLDLGRGEIVLVVRPRWRAEALVSGAGEIAALDRLRAGGDMEAAIAAGLRADAAFDFPKALVRWLDKAVIVVP